MNYLKLLLIYAAIIVLTCLSAYYFALNFIFNFYKNYELNQTQPKDSLDFYIDRLAEYECHDCPDNFRRVDSNGYYSYSCLQFQKSTFLQEVKKYQLADRQSSDTLDLMLYDCDFQKALARQMFLNDKNTYLHWKTSIITRGLGMPPEM